MLGVDKIRITGGEPLLRRDLEKLISKLSSLNGVKDLCLTTNGSLLAEKVYALQFGERGQIDTPTKDSRR